MTGRLTTPFGRESIAAEVLKGVDLAGKRAIVTGGASGIGVETARALAGAGAEATIAVRNQEAGRRTAESIDGTVLVAPLELADRASIAAFVAAWDGPLHILVNYAGMMASREAHTPEGWELQFATNHCAGPATASWSTRCTRVASGPTCSATSPRTSSTACAATPRPAGRQPSKELPHRYWRQHRPSWTELVAATSRTATRRSRTSPGRGPAWPHTRSIRRRPPGCGRSRWTHWPRGDRTWPITRASGRSRSVEPRRIWETPCHEA